MLFRSVTTSISTGVPAIVPAIVEARVEASITTSISSSALARVEASHVIPEQEPVPTPTVPSIAPIVPVSPPASPAQMSSDRVKAQVSASTKMASHVPVSPVQMPVPRSVVSTLLQIPSAPVKAQVATSTKLASPVQVPVQMPVPSSVSPAAPTTLPIPVQITPQPPIPARTLTSTQSTQSTQSAQYPVMDYPPHTHFYSLNRVSLEVFFRSNFYAYELAIIFLKAGIPGNTRNSNKSVMVRLLFDHVMMLKNDMHTEMYNQLLVHLQPKRYP